MREFDGESSAFSRVHQTQEEVRQSTTRCRMSMEREESNTLKIKLILLLPTEKKRVDY